MNKPLIAALLCFLSGTATSAVVTVDFEGVVPEQGVLFNNFPYVEEGVQIDSAGLAGIFGSNYDGSSGPPPADNTNGTTILGWCASSFVGCQNSDLITISSVNGLAFDLLSMDASNLNIGNDAGDLDVTGFYVGGGTVAAVLSTQLSVWNTFSFGSEWSELVQVTISAPGASFAGDAALDNIVVNVVPIPPAMMLFGSALVALGWRRPGKG